MKYILDPNNPIIKDEAFAIKERHETVGLMVSLPQMERGTDWELAYLLKERRIVDEAGDVLRERITSCIDRLQEVIEGYPKFSLEKSIDKLFLRLF